MTGSRYLFCFMCTHGQYCLTYVENKLYETMRLAYRLIFEMTTYVLYHLMSILDRVLSHVTEILKQYIPR